MNITLKDIANRANVSIKTVSRVINNDPMVSNETRRRINEIIDELDYQPNFIARSLKKNKTNTIGYIIPDMSNPFFGIVGKSIEKIIRKHGYSLLISSTDNTPELEIETLKLLVSKKVDGIILATLGETKEFIQNYITKFGIQIVAIDNKIRGLDIDFVLHDNVNGAYLLTKHLIDHGHKKIAFIGGPLNETSGELRFEGYKKALLENNLDLNKNLVKIGDWQIRGAFRCLSELIKNNEEFTAIFSANSLMALGVLRVLKKYGLKVPGDIAVVAFDNLDFTKATEPPLTTISKVEDKIGIMAAKLLIERIEKVDRPIHFKECLIPVKIEIRESCGCNKH